MDKPKKHLYIALILFGVLTALNGIGQLVIRPSSFENQLPGMGAHLVSAIFFCICYLCSTEVDSRMPTSLRWPIFRTIPWTGFSIIVFIFLPTITYLNLAIFLNLLIPVFEWFEKSFNHSYFGKMLISYLINVPLLSIFQVILIEIATWIYYKIKTPPF